MTINKQKRPHGPVQLVFCATCFLHADIVRLNGDRPEILSQIPIFTRAIGIDEITALEENFQITYVQADYLTREVRRRCFGNEWPIERLMLSANKVHRGELFPKLKDITAPDALEEYYAARGGLVIN